MVELATSRSSFVVMAGRLIEIWAERTKHLIARSQQLTSTKLLYIVHFRLVIDSVKFGTKCSSH